MIVLILASCGMYLEKWITYLLAIKLYIGQSGKIWTTWWTHLVPGWLRSETQLYVLSLFIPIYILLREAGLEDEPGFKMGGRNIINLHYADDPSQIDKNANELE